MNSRTKTAVKMALTDQSRRPLLLVLLFVLPFFFITRAIAETLPIPKEIVLPGGDLVLTTMKALHGASMAAITIAFLAALCGVFLIQSAREADRRLVVAGFSPFEAAVPRIAVLFSATVIVLAVSLLVTALSFDPYQWPMFVVANLIIGLTYGTIGALVGSVMGRLGATYFILFLAMFDLGVVQNPMFGSGQPPEWAIILPGYGPMRVMIEASFSNSFHALIPLLTGLTWIAALAVLLVLIMRRALGEAQTNLTDSI